MGAAMAMGRLNVSGRVQAREPSIEELEDMLYDILATGVEPTATVGTLEAVQAFLHQHARARKNHTELLSFFAENGLACAPERARVVAPALALLPMEDPSAQEESFDPSAAVSGMPERSRSQGTSNLLRVGLAFAAVLVLALGGLGYFAFSSMQHELARVHSQTGAQADELARVKADADSLRSAMHDNTELVRSVDHKSDVLIQTLLSPLDPQKLQQTEKTRAH